MASRRGRESKQVLIIFLVFFVLLTIGLGVAAYYGFAEQDGLRKAVAEAKTNQKKFEDARDYY
ncbi:MAG: hypothetical protein ACRD36_04800, partial [Candidatus Acidiferrum sp.]